MNPEKNQERCHKYHEQNKGKWPKYYRKHRQRILAKAKTHRDEKRKKINTIAMHYGCRNKTCGWRGEFHACQLEFHHFDPATKKFQLGKGADYGYKAIAAEINKCIVLCACCHALFHAGLVPLDESVLCKVDDKLDVIGKE